MFVGEFKPGSNLEKTVADMVVGEGGQIFRFCLLFDLRGRPYLDMSAQLFPRETKDEWLSIQRLGKQPHEYVIILSNDGDCKFVTKDLQGDFNISGADSNAHIQAPQEVIFHGRKLVLLGNEGSIRGKKRFYHPIFKLIAGEGAFVDPRSISVDYLGRPHLNICDAIVYRIGLDDKDNEKYRKFQRSCAFIRRNRDVHDYDVDITSVTNYSWSVLDHLNAKNDPYNILVPIESRLMSASELEEHLRRKLKQRGPGIYDRDFRLGEFTDSTSE